MRLLKLSNEHYICIVLYYYQDYLYLFQCVHMLGCAFILLMWVTIMCICKKDFTGVIPSRKRQKESLMWYQHNQGGTNRGLPDD